MIWKMMDTLILVSFLSLVGCVAEQAQLRYTDPLGSVQLGGTFVDGKVDEGLRNEKSSMGRTAVCKAVQESRSPVIRLFEGGVYYRCDFGPNWEKSCEALGTYKGNRLTLTQGNQPHWNFSMVAVDETTLAIERAFVGDREVAIESLVPKIEERFFAKVDSDDLMIIDGILKSCGVGI